MDNVFNLSSELLPSILSIIACLVAFFKGRGVSTLTSDQIEAKAEAKKQKLITKLNKKNKIKPSEVIQTSNKEFYKPMFENLGEVDTSKIVDTVETVSYLDRKEFLRDLKGGSTNGNEKSENV